MRAPQGCDDVMVGSAMVNRFLAFTSFCWPAQATVAVPGKEAPVRGARALGEYCHPSTLEGSARRKQLSPLMAWCELLSIRVHDPYVLVSFVFCKPRVGGCLREAATPRTARLQAIREPASRGPPQPVRAGALGQEARRLDGAIFPGS